MREKWAFFPVGDGADGEFFGEGEGRGGWGVAVEGGGEGVSPLKGVARRVWIGVVGSGRIRYCVCSCSPGCGSEQTRRAAWTTPACSRRLNASPPPRPPFRSTSASAVLRARRAGASAGRSMRVSLLDPRHLPSPHHLILLRLLRLHHPLAVFVHYHRRLLHQNEHHRNRARGQSRGGQTRAR